MYRLFSKTLTAPALSVALILTCGAVAPAAAMSGEADASKVRTFHQTHPNTQVQTPIPQAPPPGVPMPQVSVHTIPFRCRVEGQSGGQRYNGYQYACMLNHASSPRSLPEDCLRRVETENGRLRFYGSRCLLNSGWVLGEEIPSN